MPDVTSHRVNEKPVTVEFDPQTFVPIGAHATSFKSYLGVMAKAHVPIVATLKRIAAQQRQKLNDTPHVLSRGGYTLLKKKMRKRLAKELGLESPDLAPPPARHELWKVYRPEKQPIAQPVNEAREEAEDHHAISILTSRLNKLRKGPLEMLWELRTFGLECDVPLYINFDDAYEIIGGEKMLNISCI
ncbi:hypothetical protein LR48_Vigan08g047800 [Vigna angularis]|uniref:Uncharacterized protein n=1 Tax=Phaseolus angularis TaxID=3914 RepID=A0A0L9V3U7_PHAAN|nr:hypothetical protein LR48_Vigan08g047800 [Vigna angularis]